MLVVFLPEHLDQVVESMPIEKVKSPAGMEDKLGGGEVGADFNMLPRHLVLLRIALGWMQCARARY